MRKPFLILLGAFVLNLGLCLYLVLLVISALGEVPEGEGIRPMMLFSHIGIVSLFAVQVSLSLGAICVWTAPRKWAAYPLGLLTAALGLTPFLVSMWVVDFMIDLRGLVIAD